MIKLVPVREKETLRQHGIYFTPATLRRWHCEKRYPGLFKKVASRLFIDLDRWHELVNSTSEEVRK